MARGKVFKKGDILTLQEAAEILKVDVSSIHKGIVVLPVFDIAKPQAKRPMLRVLHDEVQKYLQYCIEHNQKNNNY